jgi:hypothetical protein
MESVRVLWSRDVLKVDTAASDLRRSPLHYVHSLAFSPHSGFLTIGNARGRVLLYRLHHYQEA